MMQVFSDFVNAHMGGYHGCGVISWMPFVLVAQYVVLCR
jgi:hypothetical protein